MANVKVKSASRNGKPTVVGHGSPAEQLSVTKSKTPKASKQRPTREAYTFAKCAIAGRRKDLKLSRLDVERATGVSVPTQMRIEGGGDVLLSTAVRLADFYGLDVGDGWGGLKKAK